MTSKVYGNRSPAMGIAAPGRSSPLRRSFQAQPSPLPLQGESLDPQAQEETARTQGHNFARLNVGAENGPAAASPPRMARGTAPTRVQGAGAGIQRKPLTGAGGVIQAHNKKKKETRQERQKRGGLNTGKAFSAYGIEGPNRIPHIKGGKGKGGSSRSSTHDHGNTTSITGAKNKAIRSGKVKRQDFQSSKLRSKVKENKKKEEDKKKKQEEKEMRFLTRKKKE